AIVSLATSVSTGQNVDLILCLPAKGAAVKWQLRDSGVLTSNIESLGAVTEIKTAVTAYRDAGVYRPLLVLFSEGGQPVSVSMADNVTVNRSGWIEAAKTFSGPLAGAVAAILAIWVKES